MINSTNENIKELLLNRLNAIYDGKPWYGRNLSSILREDKEIPFRALSILRHMIVWRTYVNKVLQGINTSIELNSEQDWPNVTESMIELLDELSQVHQGLIETIEAFDQEKWFDKPMNSSYTYYHLVEGIMDHDLYHLGQIALLKKMNKE